MTGGGASAKEAAEPVGWSRWGEWTGIRFQLALAALPAGPPERPRKGRLGSFRQKGRLGTWRITASTPFIKHP